MLRVRERKGRKEAFVEGEGAFTRMAPGEPVLSMRALWKESSWGLT